MLSESAVYTDLKFCYKLKEISFLKNVVWDTILQKLLFYTKPYPPSIALPYFNPQSNEIVPFHTGTKSSSMAPVLKKHTTSIFRQPPEDASSIFL